MKTKILMGSLIYLLTACGGGGKKELPTQNKFKNFDEAYSDEEGQPAWTPEQHLKFLDGKYMEWVLLKNAYSNSYKIDIYMETPEVDRYEQGNLVVINGQPMEYFSVDRGGDESTLGSLLTIEMIFSKAREFQNLLKDTYLNEHCYSEYGFKEKWPFPSSVEFYCDGFVPDRERQLLKINTFNGIR